MPFWPGACTHQTNLRKTPRATHECKLKKLCCDERISVARGLLRSLRNVHLDAHDERWWSRAK
jgi:hypothetical protein